MNTGDLVKVLHKGETGIGYIYDNGNETEVFLCIGISWAKGGTSTTSLKDAIDSGAEFTNCALLPLVDSYCIPHKKFVDDRGNTDWRDTGEMRG